MYSNDKELLNRFNAIVSAVEAVDTDDFIDNIDLLYRNNFKKFQIVLCPEKIFKIDNENHLLVDLKDSDKTFQILLKNENPELRHIVILNEDFLLFQYNNKQVIFLSKPIRNGDKDNFERLEQYFFERVY